MNGFKLFYLVGLRTDLLSLNLVFIFERIESSLGRNSWWLACIDFDIFFVRWVLCDGRTILADLWQGWSLQLCARECIPTFLVGHWQSIHNFWHNRVLWVISIHRSLVVPWESHSLILILSLDRWHVRYLNRGVVEVVLLRCLLVTLARLAFVKQFYLLCLIQVKWTFYGVIFFAIKSSCGCLLLQLLAQPVLLDDSAPLIFLHLLLENTFVPFAFAIWRLSEGGDILQVFIWVISGVTHANNIVGTGYKLYLIVNIVGNLHQFVTVVILSLIILTVFYLFLHRDRGVLNKVRLWLTFSRTWVNLGCHGLINR